MNAVAIGPWMVTANRLSMIVAILVFLVASFILSRKYDRGLMRWAMIGGAIALVAGRYGYVANNIDQFYPEIWRVAAVWRGGYLPHWALAGLLVYSAFKLRSGPKLRGGLMAISFALAAWFGVQQFTRPVLMKPANDIVMEQLDGPPMSVASARGKPVVINIWATWCPPCRNEMPMMAEVAAAHPGVTFLFVDQGENAETVSKYLKDNNLSLKHVLLDKEKQLPRYYGTVGIPVTLFLDAEGRLLRLYFGEIPRELLVASVQHQLDPSKPPMIPQKAAPAK